MSENFALNESIDNFYSRDDISTTVEQLMTIIDEKCTKPVNQRNVSAGFTESFMTFISDLWTSGKLADFTIVTANRKFKVHKFVMAAQSKTFAEMFKNQSHISELCIKDLSDGVVEGLLRYLYTGETSDDLDFTELFKLSSKLEIPSLKEICIDKLLYNLQHSNAFDILMLAHAYNCDELKQQAFNEIRQVFSEIKLSDGLMDNPETLHKLIDARKHFESTKKKFGEMSSEH